MRGATYKEFANMVLESWEIEYSYGKSNYFYQRSGHDGAYEIYVLRDGEVIYHRTGNDMGSLATEMLALRIYDGKTAEEVESDISVGFEA